MNDTIGERVTDDFRLKQVQVSIVNSGGGLVEQGDAKKQGNEIDWVYTTTAGNPDLAGDKIFPDFALYMS